MYLSTRRYSAKVSTAEAASRSVALVTLGVECDVLGLRTDTLSDQQRREVIAAHPRTGFKAGIVDAFYEGIKDKPQTAYGTSYTDILAAKDPSYVRPDLCALIHGSAFAGRGQP